MIDPIVTVPDYLVHRIFRHEFQRSRNNKIAMVEALRKVYWCWRIEGQIVTLFCTFSLPIPRAFPPSLFCLCLRTMRGSCIALHAENTRVFVTQTSFIDFKL